MVFGENAICLLHPQTPGFSSNQEYQNHGSQKRTSNKPISIFSLWPKCNLLLTPPNPRNFLKQGLSKPWVPKKGPVISRFQLWWFWAKMQFAYYTAKPQEFPKIRIIKTMGPQKRTSNKQISICSLWPKCDLLLTPPNPRNFLKQGLSKPWVPKKGPVTSRFQFWWF